ncbi:MAG: septal ring lytic transglycosylase RlpA family protein [Gammaproteobacteria bacterium]|nr:septal ring lytic transglycosylase RlpA family protein [Gammaproteobacteria bacterium]
MIGRLSTLTVCALILQACANRGDYDYAPHDAAEVSADSADAIPKNEPKSRYGNPKSYEIRGIRYHVLNSSEGYQQRGIASWYGTKFHGRRTSSGETYDMYKMTAAHKTLPIPCYVEVTNIDNNKKIIVKVNDRGPFHEGRIIDLSYAAAKKLGISATGTGNVEIKTVNTGHMALNTGRAILPETTGGDGRIYVQLGAFGAYDNAENLANRLRNNDYRAVRVYRASTEQSTLYKVRIGPMPSRDVAYGVLARLTKTGQQTAQIIVD